MKRRGVMLVLSSPSGAGKTSITKELLAHDAQLRASVSVTTRAPRPGEEEGKDYFFISPEMFERYLKEEAFLEHACVFGHHYGTLKKNTAPLLEEGYDVLLDIDWQGAKQLQNLGNDLVRIFILPPSLQALEDRLRHRAQDAENVIQTRMEKALGEISHWQEYDYIVINDQLQESIQKVQCILQAERLRRTRQIGLGAFVDRLTTKHP